MYTTYLMHLAKKFANIRQKSPFRKLCPLCFWAKDYRRKIEVRDVGGRCNHKAVIWAEGAGGERP